MRMSFNTMFKAGSRPTNPLRSLGKGSAKWLSILASMLVGTGILVIQFPIFFVTIVSTLFFTAAFFAFMFALKCLRVAKKLDEAVNPSTDQTTANDSTQSDRIFVEVKQR